MPPGPEAISLDNHLSIALQNSSQLTPSTSIEDDIFAKVPISRLEHDSIRISISSGHNQESNIFEHRREINQQRSEISQDQRAHTNFEMNYRPALDVLEPICAPCPPSMIARVPSQLRTTTAPGNWNGHAQLPLSREILLLPSFSSLPHSSHQHHKFVAFTNPSLPQTQPIALASPQRSNIINNLLQTKTTKESASSLTSTKKRTQQDGRDEIKRKKKRAICEEQLDIPTTHDQDEPAKFIDSNLPSWLRLFAPDDNNDPDLDDDHPQVIPPHSKKQRKQTGLKVSSIKSSPKRSIAPRLIKRRRKLSIRISGLQSQSTIDSAVESTTLWNTASRHYHLHLRKLGLSMACSDLIPEDLVVHGRDHGSKVSFRSTFRGMPALVHSLPVWRLNSASLTAFHTKLSLLQAAQHECVLSLYAVTKLCPGHCALIFERALHGTLHQINFTSLPWLQALQMATDIAMGMEFLHGCIVPPIVHGQLNSRNVYVADNLRLKVGGAILADPQRSSSEQTREYDVHCYGSLVIELFARWKSCNPLSTAPRECARVLEKLIRRCCAENANQRPSFNNIVACLDHMWQWLLAKALLPTMTGMLIPDNVDARDYPGTIIAIIMAMESAVQDSQDSQMQIWCISELSQIGLTDARCRQTVECFCRSAVICRVMQDHQENALVQASGIQILSLFNHASTDVLCLLLLAMREHVDHADIQEKGCFALCKFAGDFYVNKQLRAMGACEIVLQALKEHEENQTIQQCGIAAIQKLGLLGHGSCDEVVKRSALLHGDSQDVQNSAHLYFDS